MKIENLNFFISLGVFLLTIIFYFLNINNKEIIVLAGLLVFLISSFYNYLK